MFPVTSIVVLGWCFPMVSAFFLGGGWLKWGIDQFRRNPLDEYTSPKETLFQQLYEAQWYVVGVATDFHKTVPKPVMIWNQTYFVWRDSLNKYHAWSAPNTTHGVTAYSVVDNGGLIWMNRNLPSNTSTRWTYPPFREKEWKREKSFRQTYRSADFELDAQTICEKSLHRKHYGLIYPPLTIEPIVAITPLHYRLKCVYESVANAIGKCVFGRPYLVVETEFYLPYTTLLRVMYGKYTTTLVLSCLPIRDSFSRLFVKTHRNFLRNAFGDWITNVIVGNVLANIRARHDPTSLEKEEYSLAGLYRTTYDNQY
jgi:hypothetical protein